MDEEAPWIQETREKVLTIFNKRECSTTLLLDELIDCFLQEWNLFQQNQTIPLDEHLAVEVERFVSSVLKQLPHIFVHRYGSMLKQSVIETILQKEQQCLATVCLTPNHSTTQDYAMRYKSFFKLWLKDPTLYSITTTYPSVIEKISLLPLKHVFVLHLFIFGTCKRIKNDNLCCLSVTGISTIGKSSLIENPLEHICYNITAESGCNRFQLDTKSIMLLHDADPKLLLSKQDANIYRCVARAEVCKVKTYGSVSTLPAVFLLLTSNQTIHTHSFSIPNSPLKQVQQSSLLKRHTKSHTNKTNDETVKAIQNRFLEIYFRKRPPIPKEYFPHDGRAFTRQHFIVGLFKLVMNILLAHPKPHFYYSTMVPIYCISGLLHHLPLYCDVMCLDKNLQVILKNKLLTLKKDFFFVV